MVAVDPRSADELKVERSTEFCPKPGGKMWRRVMGAFAVVDESDDLVGGDERKEVCKQAEPILFFEVVGEDGRLAEDHDVPRRRTRCSCSRSSTGRA